MMEEVKGIRMNGMDVMIDECFDRDNIWFEGMVCDELCEKDKDRRNGM